MREARRLWMRLETIHAVTYFADESRAAAAEAGLKGFWMGYFGFRAAPLGAVGPATVSAVFANFAPAMVARAIPDAWSFVAPGQLVMARAAAAATALRRLAPEIDELAEAARPALRAVVAAGSVVGRPLFSANAAVAAPTDPVAELWQLCTTMREHRGDGHELALAAADVDGCGAHRLQVAARGVPAEILVDNRGWSAADWSAASQVLERRRLLDGDGAITRLGQALHDEIEETTDRLALAPFSAALDGPQRRQLLQLLDGPARRIASSGLMPYPNPMGLPELDSGPAAGVSGRQRPRSRPPGSAGGRSAHGGPPQAAR